MPRSTLLLRLPQPCQESWDAMTPTGPGRHCATCQKTVVDFTQKTDGELLAYFRQARPDQTCGRFRSAQLGRPLAARPAAAVRWQYWLAGLLVAALTAQSCQNSTIGEVEPMAPRHLAPPAFMGDTTLVGDIDTLVPDSAIVSPAPPPGCTLTKQVLGEPAIMG